jgi:hypothetical protein
MSVATLEAPASADQHISAAEALRRYPQLSRTRLYRLAVGSEVRVILPPGRPPRYNAADLDRIMNERGA